MVEVVERVSFVHLLFRTALTDPGLWLDDKQRNTSQRDILRPTEAAHCTYLGNIVVMKNTMRANAEWLCIDSKFSASTVNAITSCCLISSIATLVARLPRPAACNHLMSWRDTLS
jgi:hypothetical protein